MPTSITDFSRHGFCLHTLANLVPFAERNFSKKLNETPISSLTMSSEEDFFSEFYHSDKIVTENEGNVEVLSISCALPI